MTDRDNIFRRIADAMLVDYVNIFYVDMTTNAYYWYYVDQIYHSLQVEQEGDDFFAGTEKNVGKIIYEEDRVRVLESLRKERLLENIAKGKMEDIDCTEYDMFCREYSYNDRKYADCFDANDECQVLEDVKMACAYKNSVGELSLWKCLKPDNSTDQKLYWVKTKVVNCENGCNNTKDGCGD